jgi:3-methylcrotonyl-CoA carboxylase alpha subunit
MERAGVPLTPGYHGDNQEERYLREQADRLGYPVLIKASAGGGGRGMRRVDTSGEFAAALISCKREASASFGDDRVLVEKYLLEPRHIEMQVFADSHGHCLHLFERDCSVQRRHQKVLEEAPAPGMTAARRAAMGAAAVRAASAVGYVGAGTVEFIATRDGEFFFMEMNTRLQVEHPVTEMITGLDLVEWQLRVAAGEALPLTQPQLEISGHALEARVYAEDPERGFLPAVGRLEYFSAPAPSRHVRIDAGVGQGDVISPYYDSMIAKLIVWDQTRDLALARMHEALARLHIVGVANNVAFLDRLVGSPEFASADLDTALIDRAHDHLFPAATAPGREVWLAAALTTLLRTSAAAADTPWMTRDGWRVGERAQRSLIFHSGPHEKAVQVRYLPVGWQLSVDAQSSIARGSLEGTDLTVEIDSVRSHAKVFRSADSEHLFMAGGHFALTQVDPLTVTPVVAASPGGLRSPMPGRVIELIASAGTEVVQGQPLLVLEAMKIEHTIKAPGPGTLRAFKVAAGEQVGEGAELVDFAPAPPK